MKLPIVRLLPLLMLLLGCPKTAEPQASGATEAAAWLVFEVFESGTGNGLSATVWPKDQPDDFETIVAGEAGSAVRFAGIGRRDEGYALTVTPGDWLHLLVWSPGHELVRAELRVKKGQNVVTVNLKRTEVEDERVPERIRLEVLEALPTQGPKSGG